MSLSLVREDTVLSNHYRLEKDIQEWLKPFNLTLYLIFSNKYSIKNNYIACKTRTATLVTSFCLSIGIIVSLYNHLHTNDPLSNIFSKFLSAAYMIEYHIGLVIVIIINITHRRENISLILMIQVIHKSINIGKCFKSFIIWNWILISILFFICFGFFATIYFSSNQVKFYDFFGDIIYMYFDLNLIHGICILTLLTKYLEEWTNSIIMPINEPDDEEYYNKLCSTYKDILKAYDLYKQTIHIVVSFNFMC